MTLKYGKGHWKWCAQVKLKDQYNHAEFDINHIHGVWENPKVKLFDKPRQMTDQKRVISLKYTQRLRK